MGGSEDLKNIMNDADAAVAELNKKYAVCIVGGRPAVIVEQPGGYALWTERAFAVFLANQKVWRGDNKISLAKCFIEHDNTRRYSGITFAPAGAPPGVYNIWQGFSVKPAPGNYATFRDHLLNNVCGGDPEHFTWVMGWFAHMIQRPGEKIGTALVLGGESGAGKTIVGEIVGSLFEPHYMLIDNPRLVTGNFNAHAAPLLMLHADEAFFAGDRAAVGRLRSLVTAKILPIEFKGRDVEKVRSCVRLLVTSEQPWIVPTSRGERRFAVLEVSASRKGDHTYFKTMMTELASGGREGLLHDLQNFDLADAELREIPKTAALLAQKFAGLEPHETFWATCLERGTVLETSNEWETDIGRSLLYDSYVEFAQKLGARHRIAPGQFSVALGEMCPGLYGTRLRRGGKRLYVYRFPDLDTAQKGFDAYLAQPGLWDGTAESEA